MKEVFEFVFPGLMLMWVCFIANGVFADIFEEAEIKGVTVVVMEVPCCSALPAIVRRGMERAGRQIPLEEIVIGRRGEILKRHKMAA